jgi:hypothetical protein
MYRKTDSQILWRKFPRNSFKTVRNIMNRGIDSFSILKLLITDLEVLGRRI